MVVSVHPARSADYYIDKVASERHDYYAGHGEAPGMWTGELAKMLGLAGEVTPDAFRAVLAETHPDTGQRLKRWRNTKVTAWDIHFAPPKSVSALWAIAPPEAREHIRQAQAAAMTAGLDYLARHACVARLGKQGVNAQPGSGFATAAFTHRTSREGDPQLHTHAVTANLAQAHDGRRAALDGARFYTHRFAADGIYQAALRAELSRRLGLGWVERDEQWEIAGIPAGLCRRWSTRRAQIEQQMAARGVSGGRAAEAAALATRRPRPDIAPDGQNLHDRFQQEARDAGHTPEQILLAALHRDPGDDQEQAQRLAADLTEQPRAADRCDELAHVARVARPHAPARTTGPGGRGRGPADPRLTDTAAESTVEAVIEPLVGPTGLTEKASSFGRRDVIDHASRLLPRLGPSPASSAEEAAALLETIADRVTRDPRVIPLLEPAGRTSGEVIRPRDAHGRVLREVCTQVERRYSTVDLLAAEHELLQRAQTRQTADVALIDPEQVEAALAAFPDLDPDQQAMVRQLASSGAGVDVVVGKAGTGKTTAIRCYAHAAHTASLQVLGLAPSATAAHQLSISADIDACTVDKLLVDVAHDRRRLPAGVVVIVDEAAMVDTRNRLALQRLVDDAGGKIVDVGDHRQIPSVDVGGIHHVLATRLGAVTLGVNHRFRNPAFRDAADLIRDGHADKGIAQLRALGAVHEHDQPADAWTATVTDWAKLRADGADVRMLATERAVVANLNHLARHHLIRTGEVAKRGRVYLSDDDSRDIELATGERVRLGRNDSRLPQPDGTTITVRNGMTGTIARTSRSHVTVELDPHHRDPDGPARYAGGHLDYGYATTADKAQAATCDHSLFVPSPATSAERAYVALSRGRHSNRIYATADSGWDQAIATSRAHTLALHQQPDWTHHQHEGRQVPTRQPLNRGRRHTTRRVGAELYNRVLTRT